MAQATTQQLRRSIARAGSGMALSVDETAQPMGVSVCTCFRFAKSSGGVTPG